MVNAPGTPEYRKHLRDQDKQLDTSGTSGVPVQTEETQDNEVYNATDYPAGVPSTPPTKFPLGADTENPVNDE